MKVIIQIPCLNEAATISRAVMEIPRQIPGVDRVEILVIDDGSTDDTSEVARRAGVDHIVRHVQNRGLARAFLTGIDAAIRLGADIIVNTDADNQYQASDIPRLIEPILAGRAEMVVGDRQVGTIESFSPSKRLLQRFGSWIVRQASATDIPDTTSGFRALSRDAALQLFVHDDYTYTLETIIQAGVNRVALAHIPVGTNAPARSSRLMSSIPDYVRRSAGTILRVYAMYRPLRTFTAVALLLLIAAVGIGARFLYYFIVEPSRSGHVQSLLLGSVLAVVAFQIFFVGVLADLVAANRRLLEDIRTRVRKLEGGGSGSKGA